MPSDPLLYDSLAGRYDDRYAVNPLSRVAERLRRLAAEAPGTRVLEVGCGTGRWLGELVDAGFHPSGADNSLGMLARAARRRLQVTLVRANAGELPFADGSFDLVFCVNAIHHFPRPRTFLDEAARLLAKGGLLGVFGMDPRHPDHRWFLYDYFPGTRETDLARFPSTAELREWMSSAGLAGVAWEEVERVVGEKRGRAVLSDPFLRKGATSQLALLSDEAYAAGLRRIEQVLQEAENRGEGVAFPVELTLGLTSARLG